MTASDCTAPLAMSELSNYWFGEGGHDRDAQIEEHLLNCSTCSARLAQILALSDGIKQIVLAGDLGAVVTGPFLERLKRGGLRVREYHVQSGGSVLCTIAPDDDLVVGRLRAPLAGVGRLDLLLRDPSQADVARMRDVPFNPQADEVIFAPRAAYLRQLDTLTQRLELVAVEGSADRTIGEYTFNHSRYR